MYARWDRLRPPMMLNWISGNEWTENCILFLKYVHMYLFISINPALFTLFIKLSLTVCLTHTDGNLLGSTECCVDQVICFFHSGF